MKKRIVSTLLTLALALSLLPAQPTSAAPAGLVNVARVGTGGMALTNTAWPTITGWWAKDGEFEVEYTITNTDGKAGHSLFAILNYSVVPMKQYKSGLSTLDAGWELRFFDVYLEAGQIVTSGQDRAVQPWRTRTYGQRVLDGDTAMAVIYFKDEAQRDAFRDGLDWFVEEGGSASGGGTTSYVDTEAQGTSESYALSYTKENRTALRKVLEKDSPTLLEKSEPILSPFPGVDLKDIVIERGYTTDEIIDVSADGQHASRSHLGVDIKIPDGVTTIQTMVSGEASINDSLFVDKGYEPPHRSFSFLHESGLVFTYDGIGNRGALFGTCYLCGGYFESSDLAKPSMAAMIAEMHHNPQYEAGQEMEDVGAQTACYPEGTDHPALHLEITQGLPKHSTSLYYRNPDYYLADDAAALDPEPILRDGVLTWTVFDGDPWSKALDPNKDFSILLLQNLKHGNQNKSVRPYDTYNQSKLDIAGYLLGQTSGYLALDFTNETDGIDTGGVCYMMASILAEEVTRSTTGWTEDPDPDKYYPMETVLFQYYLLPGESTRILLPVTFGIAGQEMEGTMADESWREMPWTSDAQLLIGRPEDQAEFESVSGSVRSMSYSAGTPEQKDETILYQGDFAVLGYRLDFQEMLYELFGSSLPR